MSHNAAATRGIAWRIIETSARFGHSDSVSDNRRRSWFLSVFAPGATLHWVHRCKGQGTASDGDYRRHRRHSFAPDFKDRALASKKRAQMHVFCRVTPGLAKIESEARLFLIDHVLQDEARKLGHK
jgi:hypothetical protein